MTQQRLPRFFFSIIIVDILLLMSLVFVTLRLSPTEPVNQILFLGLLTAVLTLTSSMILYKINSLRRSLFAEPRYVYHKMFRRGLLISLAVTIPLGLKFWGSANKLSVVLLILFLGVVEAYLSYRR